MYTVTFSNEELEEMKASQYYLKNSIGMSSWPH